MKNWAVAFTILVSLSAALPARAEFLAPVLIGYQPPDTYLYAYPGKIYLTSSLTGAVTTYSFDLSNLPSTTPGVITTFHYASGQVNSLYELYGVPQQDPSAYIQFNGGVLQSVSYNYEQGSRSVGFTIISLGGLTYTNEFIPPVGPSGPIGSVSYDTGTISFFPASANAPEPSSFALLALGVAGLPARSLWRRLSTQRV